MIFIIIFSLGVGEGMIVYNFIWKKLTLLIFFLKTAKRIEC